MANLSSYLCHYRNKKILVIDWDLDAPGLHFYFDKKDLRKKGIIELFTEYKDTIRRDKGIEEDELPRFSDEYITEITKSKNGSGCIDIVTAGEYSDTYTRRVNDFNWHKFYEQFDGKLYVEFLKENLHNMGYDFIFIDSRTGVSDYSGICNIQLPDINVIVVSPTMQNLEGAVRIANSISRSSYVQEGMRKAVIMPLLSRIDLSIEHKTGEWFDLFFNTFVKYIRDLCTVIAVPDNEYIKETILDYKRDISFEEQLLFDDNIKEMKTNSLAIQYKNISSYIERLKNVLHEQNEKSELIVKIELKGEERTGIVDEVSKVIVNNSATKMRNITTDTSNHFIISTHLFIENLNELSELVKELKQIDGIENVKEIIQGGIL